MQQDAVEIVIVYIFTIITIIIINNNIINIIMSTDATFRQFF